MRTHRKTVSGLRIANQREGFFIRPKMGFPHAHKNIHERPRRVASVWRNTFKPESHLILFADSRSAGKQITPHELGFVDPESVT